VALVDCPECGKQISTLAVACPHCGFPLPRGMAEIQGAASEPGPSRWTDPGFWVIVIGLVVVIILSVILLQQAGKENGTETTVPVVTTEATGPAGPGFPAPGRPAVLLA
jgi:hypothetical protein